MGRPDPDRAGSPVTLTRQCVEKHPCQEPARLEQSRRKRDCARTRVRRFAGPSWFCKPSIGRACVQHGRLERRSGHAPDPRGRTQDGTFSRPPAQVSQAANEGIRDNKAAVAPHLGAAAERQDGLSLLPVTHCRRIARLAGVRRTDAVQPPQGYRDLGRDARSLLPGNGSSPDRRVSAATPTGCRYRALRYRGSPRVADVPHRHLRPGLRARPYFFQPCAAVLRASVRA